MQSIYVGNLNWNMSSEQLQEVFEKIGSVTSSRVITDRETGRSKGFGFVEMSLEDANKAVAQLDGQEVEGRNLKVNLAEDKKKTTGGFTRSPSTSSYDRPSRDSYSDNRFQDLGESKPRSKKNWGGGNY